ncbi:unnamed protein product [Arctia plantaginis]|uniref:PAP-associated domain-containing protein n=1 Tax=Arctia plantaginis TaxID=874455 RepID=A0A8S1A352_ARCPL|nr:unnamed protein product [Arctia plantaginis]
MLTAIEMANFSNVFHDLQGTLQTIWPGSEVVPLGSFVTGLATKSSDADCMVKMPDHNLTSVTNLVLEAAHLLRRHPLLYENVISKIDAKRRIPLLKFIYIPTKRNCDVNFISNIGLQNSLMMGYYLNLEKKFLSLAAILKLWSKVHRLRSTDTLASNTLNLLIIFYLQQYNLAPPFHLLQKHLLTYPMTDWVTSFKTVSYNSTTKVSLYQLLGGFFKYYSTFNYEEYIVSPLLGYPLARKSFEDINSLPKEMFLYKNYVRKPDSKPLILNTTLCIQDAIEQRRNTAAEVSENNAIIFMSHVRFAARMFDVLPKEMFLKVLLDTNVFSKKMFKNKLSSLR